MSTRLTNKGVPMVDSQTLQLAIGAMQVSDLVSKYLSSSLISKGYDYATPAALNFLSALECGVNYGSEIARNLGVSRQMVAKTVKGLCQAGYLEQEDGVGKQKKILFTVTGELLMSDARQLLAYMDKGLNTELSKEDIDTTVRHLNKIHKLINHLSNS